MVLQGCGMSFKCNVTITVFSPLQALVLTDRISQAELDQVGASCA